MAPPYATMLEEFVVVFKPLPSGLPPKREMAHTIPLEPDEKPPFKPIYRSSPLELHGLRRRSRNTCKRDELSPIHRFMDLPYYLSRKRRERYEW